ncbi:hypothetical protein [Pseudobacillus badius]|uniref:hypothetical protein n=1 Tax=Bacillus badius TaxID=1455 RepID=UPI0007B3B3D5|nr:hypothetical protein [Bacillus badius]KZR58982.1 hypothetical protein A3781_00290 [Bacillus badius]
MATTTRNYNLVKPDLDDLYDIHVFNKNADIIDNKLKALDDATGNLGDLITDDKSSLISAINNVKSDLEAHEKDFMPHQDYLCQFGSNPDIDGVYRVVDFKTVDGKMHMKSTLSNPDMQNNYQTLTWEFYDEKGLAVVRTVYWTITYDNNGVAISKVVE